MRERGTVAALVTQHRLPTDAAFGLFAAARSVGLLAHSIEQLAEPKVIRPRGRYVGVRPVVREQNAGNRAGSPMTTLN